MAGTAARLARAYGVDECKARLAGLLHDWDKGYDDAGIRARVEELGLAVDPYVFEEMPWLLHGPTAAAALARAFPCLPRDVVQAIARHTAGAVGMTDLDMVVYVADALEPGRDYAGLDEIRALAGPGAARGAVPGNVQACVPEPGGAAQAHPPAEHRDMELLPRPLARRGGRTKREERNSVSEPKKMEEKTSRERALIAARAADAKKATDIMVQEVRDLIGVTDYFVIATAANNRQVEAIVDEIEEAERVQGGCKPLRREGAQDGTWSLLDYGDIVGARVPAGDARVLPTGGPVERRPGHRPGRGGGAHRAGILRPHRQAPGQGVAGPGRELLCPPGCNAGCGGGPRALPTSPLRGLPPLGGKAPQPQALRRDASSSRRSAIHVLMTAWRPMPMRRASRSSASTTQAGKSTFTRRVSNAGSETICLVEVAVLEHVLLALVERSGRTPQCSSSLLS